MTLRSSAARRRPASTVSGARAGGSVARWTRLGAIAISVAGLSAWGCSGNEPAATSKTAADPKDQGIDETIKHEKCDESGNRVESFDANNDGKADIKRVFDAKANREICRISDLNRDGKPDMFEYFDEAGNVRRRELAFENTDAITKVEIYQGGKLVEAQLDTTGQRRLDTWIHFDPATGKRSKIERDTGNDGKIDEWWTYNDDGTVTIAKDKNGDGQPDPDATMTVTASGTLITPDAGPPANANTSSEAGAPPPPPPPPVLMPEDDAGALDAGADAGKKKGATAPKGKGK